MGIVFSSLETAAFHYLTRAMRWKGREDKGEGEGQGGQRAREREREGGREGVRERESEEGREACSYTSTADDYFLKTRLSNEQ